jgi:ABC-type branched-subunit amino acid transport system permease subunit
MSTPKKLAVFVPLALLLAYAATWLLPRWVVYLLLISATKGLVVLGLIVLWRTGLVPFGQALFYATGGYAAALLGRYYGVTDVFLLMSAGLAVSVAMAAIVGLLLARYREIFFAMLSLAFSMIVYGILVKTQALGSTDGISVVRPTFFGYAPQTGLERINALVILTAGVAVTAALLVRAYLSSTLGRLTTGIRDNEIRVEYLGISVRRVVYLKVVLAGALAGVGGVLEALAVGHVAPDMAYWTTSGGFVFVTILGGAGSVVAPFIGSLIFELIRSFAMEYAPAAWQIILGGALLLTILFLPNGLWSLFQRRATGGKA